LPESFFRHCLDSNYPLATFVSSASRNAALFSFRISLKSQMEYLMKPLLQYFNHRSEFQLRSHRKRPIFVMAVCQWIFLWASYFGLHVIRRTRQCKIGIVISHNAVGGIWFGVHFSISLRRAHCRLASRH
jgi:hypothetical protein